MVHEVTDADREGCTEALSKEGRRLSEEIGAFLFILSDEDLASIDEYDDRIRRVLHASPPFQSRRFRCTAPGF